MLGFGMETKRISDIIKAGAESRATDKEFLEMEISKWLKSPERLAMIHGNDYYTYHQDIAMKQRKVLSDTGVAVDTNLPNNRLCDNQYAAMVDQKVNYILSQQVAFDTDNEQYADLLRQTFNRRFGKLLKNVGKDAYNGGIAWVYPYYDENGAFRFKRFKPWECLPFWKDDEHTELDFFVRVYDMMCYEGKEEQRKTFVEVYDLNGVHHFSWENDKLIPDYSTGYFDVAGADGNTIPYNWERIPLIAFRSNAEEIPLICKCKSLQDAINEVLSTFKDGMDENAGGNSILVIHNYGGQDLGEFRRNLAQYRAVKVESVDGVDGGIDAIKVEVNAENFKLVLEELRKALVKNCKGYDVEELKSNGSPNEMTIKAVFSNIDMDANELEAEFQSSFEDLLWFVNAYYKNSGLGDYSSEVVDVIFNRDLMINESQIIEDCQKSVGIISKKTILANHPWTVDTEEEWQQLQDEESAAADLGLHEFSDLTQIGGDADEEDN